MCEKIERYAEEREIKRTIKVVSEYESSKEAVIKKVAEIFDLTEENAEKYYDEALHQ